MPRCKVAAYLIEVRKLNASSKQNLKFGSFDGAADLRDTVLKYLQKMVTYSKVAHFQKTFKVVLDNPVNTGALTGMVFAGDYGQASDIIDADSGKITYKKKKTESLPSPFYFHLELPPNETRGILCLQQSGLNGVKSLFEGAISGQLQKYYPDYRLHVRSMTLADALKEFLKTGSVEEITVEKHEIPADIADAFGGVKKAYPGVFSYSVRPSSGLFKKDGLIAFANGQKELEDIFEFGDHGFDVVTTKIRVGDEIRKVNLTKPNSINSSFDITDDVKLGPDGHPTKDSLSKEFNKIVAEIAKRGGIQL